MYVLLHAQVFYHATFARRKRLSRPLLAVAARAPIACCVSLPEKAGMRDTEGRKRASCLVAAIPIVHVRVIRFHLLHQVPYSQPQMRSEVVLVG